MTKVEVSFLGPIEIRDLAVQLDIVPAKKSGQSLVHDANTMRRIVAAADLPEDSYPAEAGPSLGSLTLGLLEHCSHAATVEVDHRLAARLPQTATERARGCTLKLTEKDALKVSREDFQTAPDALVANLSYNVSVPVLLHVLAGLPAIHHMLVMVQSEVADQLAAQPGSKIYDVPGVKVAYYGTVRRAGATGPHTFWPVPRVDSGFVRINYYARPDTPGISDVSDAPEATPQEISPQFRARLFLLIDTALAQHRKTLRAALSGICRSGAAAEEALMAAGIDPGQRGGKLEIANFIRLAEVSR